MEFTWTIQLFAGLPERFGTPFIRFTAEQSEMTAGQLKDTLIANYPEHEEWLRISFVACNQTYAPDDAVVHAADELAMLPPVSGGDGMTDNGDDSSLEPDRYIITAEPLRSDEVLAKVVVPAHGASIIFVGTTREWTEGKRTVRLEYEAYAPMAIRMMEQIGEEIAERWNGALTAISHRIGTVDLAEISVIIAVSAPHRDSCYEASRYAIERLKQIVPIWKKEIWEDGSEWKGHQQGPWKPDAPLHF
ncbi:molybdenum cofactor biosynthesis protein MoaE [Paenibacillus sp. NPDC058071]|uniref:molybdenum cofactor biosynthesis protein n=1 Tax=Paenibacillus sp. NPDC058071 TaxID=3346326 RepID=UPI0036DEE481